MILPQASLISLSISCRCALPATAEFAAHMECRLLCMHKGSEHVQLCCFITHAVFSVLCIRLNIPLSALHIIQLAELQHSTTAWPAPAHIDIASVLALITHQTRACTACTWILLSGCSLVHMCRPFRASRLSGMLQPCSKMWTGLCNSSGCM